MTSPAATSGKVYLVSAGPGDPGLLTLRGAEVLGRGDVVLYDALANAELLKHASPAAELICVGKHGSGRIWNQAEIEREMLRHAAAGRHVVRLKGGDTSIFARTGEELESLIAHGVAFEVVPGCTSASAASAYAGIPLTHRDWASAVALVTGHHQATDTGEEADEDVDWETLARFPGTLVLYMAVTNTRRWSGRLLAGGLPGSTPVAIVRHASLPQQTVLRTTLEQVADFVEGPPKLRPPVLFIIGSVAGLTADLDWFTRRPLWGQTVVLTRPAGQNESLAQTLRDLGADVVCHPAVELRPPREDGPEWERGAAEGLRRSVLEADRYDVIIFSSANGVRFWLDELLRARRDVRAIARAKLAGVGPSVETALAQYSLRCDHCLGSEGDAASLAELLEPLVRSRSVLNVTTDKAASTLRDSLAASASRWVEAVAYVSSPAPPPSEDWIRRLEGCGALAITATSRAIAASAWQQFGGIRPDARWLALRGAVAAELRSLGAVDVSVVQSVDEIPERMLADSHRPGGQHP